MPTGRHYNGTSDSCPALSSSTTVRYGYDLGSNAIGRRTHMTDTTGSTVWVYDARGRVTGETKLITGAGTFYTQWAYDAADRLKSTTYPGGQVRRYIAS